MTKIDLFWKELALFGLAQAVGIAVAYRYLIFFKPQDLMPTGDWSLDYADILIVSVFLLIFIFFTVRKTKASYIFFKLFFWIIIFSGSQAVFSTFLSDIFSLAAAVLLVFLIAKIRRVWIQNLGVILGIAGIGAAVGLSLTPLTAVFVLVILSFYDIIAVYFTGHMIKMAEGMIKARAIFGLIIPGRASGFKEKIGNVEPGEKFMILGSGDIALPLVLAVSLVRISILQASIVAIFAAIGLFITHKLFVSQKERKPMAALPPIAAMSIIGYLLASFL